MSFAQSTAFKFDTRKPVEEKLMQDQLDCIYQMVIHVDTDKTLVLGRRRRDRTFEPRKIITYMNATGRVK